MTVNKTNLTKSLIFCAVSLGTASSANATTGTFDVGFRTITDVTIVETQALNFGTTVLNTQGGNCTMTASAATVSETDSAIDGPGTTDDSAGQVSGTGCLTTLEGVLGNQVGIYTLGGISGSDINVTVNEVIVTDFTFTPDTGCYSVYDGAAASALDTCDAFFPGSTFTTPLADGTDAGDAGVTDAELRVVVGGSIDITTTLSSNTNYTDQFTIDAIY